VDTRRAQGDVRSTERSVRRLGHTERGEPQERLFPVPVGFGGVVVAQGVAESREGPEPLVVITGVQGDRQGGAVLGVRVRGSSCGRQRGAEVVARVGLACLVAGVHEEGDRGAVVVGGPVEVALFRGDGAQGGEGLGLADADTDPSVEVRQCSAAAG
jgi:hypothetical protein